MLQFGMETKRINEIINTDAAKRLTDKEFLEKEIQKFLFSQRRKDAVAGENYYTYVQDILDKKRMVIGENGELVEDKALPNNKFIDNQYADMVDQKVNYLFSQPITFNTDNENYGKALKSVFTKRFRRLIKNLAKDCYNGGIGWLYVYYDEKGQLSFKRFRPWEILPFWKDDEHTELETVVRIYQVEGYKNDLETTFTYVEVYDTEGIHKFEYDSGVLIPDYSAYYFELNTEGEVISYNWDRIPIIPFRANSSEISLIRKCKSLQDGINFILSAFGDGMEENASGNTILILKNYDGQNLGEFRKNLSAYKAVKVRTIDGNDGGIDSLQIEVNAENYKAILTELRKALIKNCKGYDIEELKASGSPNEMTIKSIYSSIDLDANEIESEFQASFEDLLWFINQHFNNTGLGDFEDEEVEIILDRDMMVNESQVIADVNASAGVLSKRTLVSMHPYTTDVDKELEQIEAENLANMELYSNAFGQGDVDEGEEEG